MGIESPDRHKKQPEGKVRAHRASRTEVDDLSRSQTKGIQRVLSEWSFTRVWSVIQFTSQVLPPSSEKDCSKWGESVVMFVQTNRIRMVLPLIVSWAKNSPR